MMVLSARFAVLACLCAALPLALPPPVEAAHLHGSHSMEKHVSSSHSHSQHRTRSALPSATHTHDGKHQGHRAQDQRSPGLPPLLRRHRVHDNKLGHDHQSQGPHDHAHPKSSRSAFARSRYSREPGSLSRRSSVYVPGEHGDTYLVSRTLPRKWGHWHKGTVKQTSHAYNRRQFEESDLALGRIDIMGGSTQRLASLTVDSAPIDWTSGQNSSRAFSLNASSTNQTQFIMVPTDDPSSTAGSLNKHVALATEVFDAGSAEMVMYCATYDPDPGSTSALLMTPCTGTTQSAAPADYVADPCSDENDASSSNAHESQIFSYDPSSGKIEPISATSSSSGVGADSFSCGGARVRRDNGNSTTSGSARPSSTSTSTAPTTSASQLARNVTLIYVAVAPEVPVSSSTSSNSTNASIGQTAVFTTTITTTVVATVTTSGSSNRTVTPAQAAASDSASSPPSQSTTNIATPSVPATASRSSLSSLSSVPTTATSKAPANANESLEVEIVGVTPTTSSTTSSSSTSATTTTTTTTSSYSSVSPSLNAQAVASSIANAMVHPRYPVFVSTTGNVTPP